MIRRSPKIKSTTMWLAFLSMLIIGLIVGMKLDWAASIGMTLCAIPLAYVTGNKAINYKHGNEIEERKE